MDRQPKRIAITLRVVHAASYPEKRDALSQDWPAIMETLECYLFLIPNTLSNVSGFLNSVEPDGLILSGGDDIGDHPERDRTEAAILSYGMKRRLPILGVCRGMQAINKLLGGSIDHPSSAEHVNTRHSVRITQNRFAQLLNREMVVNSFHRNVISTAGLAEGLRPFAIGYDGTIEGYSHAALPILGVMWHPERDANAANAELLRHVFANKTFWTTP
jgi:putative glutamine amidotransferase